MKRAVYLPQDELVRRAVNALVRELGPVESSRFLTLPQEQRMDSVRRHRTWQSTLDKDSFFRQIFGDGTSAGES